jgi:hypothetical protein
MGEFGRPQATLTQRVQSTSVRLTDISMREIAHIKGLKSPFALTLGGKGVDRR